ncbi:S-adenosyl-L-methionine-dependent methyltransferase [Rhexocercosporidium sp. MPI-PUGE-AT-0058]|nr:S-adenosyl-L-methionine-dependent methyltransferase [Rhexocercosporidium sp. MPI-PUGE-AT-0058]
MAAPKQQYDTIQGPYDYIRGASIAFIERENVNQAVEPFIKGARVLELACGSGFYTYSFLEWGATSVLGVDISSVMINSAQHTENAKDKNVSFIQADCSIPTSYPGSPFDVVFGAWLLNYAPDRAGLVNMFRNISLNLKPGGHFVSITVPPSSSPIDSINAEIVARPMPAGSGYLIYQPIKDVDDGVFFNVHGETPVGDLDFECFHLRREVYEEAAREAGLRGELRWGVTEVPERYLRGEGEGGADMVELESYKTVPNYGVLVITK